MIWFLFTGELSDYKENKVCTLVKLPVCRPYSLHLHQWVCPWTHKWMCMHYLFPQLRLTSKLLHNWSSWEAELGTLPMPLTPPFQQTSAQRVPPVKYIFFRNKLIVQWPTWRLRIVKPRHTCPSFLLILKWPQDVSIPFPELCADLVAAQLAHVLKKELTLTVACTVLWSN